MNRIICLLILCLGLHAGFSQHSFSTPQSLSPVKAIPGPARSTMDIAFDGQYLWEVSTDSFVYKIAVPEGRMIKRMRIYTDYAAGLAFDGRDLWYSDRSNHRLVKIDTLIGEELQEIPIDGKHAGGLAYAHSNLWMNSNNQKSIAGDTTFQISAQTGEVISFFIPIGDQPTGLTFDGTFLWQTDNRFDKMYKIDIRDHSILDSLEIPGGDYPNGLAFDGQYLWVSNNESDSIYQIDIGHGFHSNGLKENMANYVSVYPNPSFGEFVLEWKADNGLDQALVTVFSPTGAIVLEKRINNYGRTILNLQVSGIYFYTLSAKGSLIQSGKLIKK